MQDDINFRGRVDLALSKHVRFKDRIACAILVFIVLSATFAGIAYGWATGLFILFAMVWVAVLARYIQRHAMGDWEVY